VGTLFNESALGYHAYVVRFLDSGEFVGDSDCRTVGADIVERLLHNLLGPGVQGTCCFVEQ
jgi:hypothetical protein